MNEQDQLEKTKQASLSMDAITASVEAGIPVPLPYLVKGKPMLGKRDRQMLREDALSHLQQLEILCAGIFEDKHVWRGIVSYN